MTGLNNRKVIMNKNGYVYIITNKHNTTLYIGVTSNLIKRIWEHKNKVVNGFSETYNLNKLVYFEIYENIENAINRERYLKGKKRNYKQDLISNFNKDWIDLYPQIVSL
jgi:putative endonuclease